MQYRVLSLPARRSATALFWRAVSEMLPGFRETPLSSDTVHVVQHATTWAARRCISIERWRMPDEAKSRALRLMRLVYYVPLGTC